MKFVQPMHDRLLVSRMPEPPKSIVITDADLYRYFKVIAIGPKVREVKPHDVVALPGVASAEPDHIIEEGQFIREADIGFIYRESR